MCSCTKMRAMRDRDPRSQRHTSKIINKNMLADRAFVSCFEIPGKINHCRWIYMHTSANLRSEDPKQESSPSKTRPRTKSEKRQCNRPEYTAHHLARCVLLLLGDDS